MTQMKADRNAPPRARIKAGAAQALPVERALALAVLGLAALISARMMFGG